jgi:hypothetical protein
MRFILRKLLIRGVLAGVIGLLGVSQGALAQQATDITVTADISSAMSMTFCDTTAEFGLGLTALGGMPTGTPDAIYPSPRGNRSLGQGTIYAWIPSCPAGQQQLTIESTIPWQVGSCATDNGGSSSLSAAQGDLRYAASFSNQGLDKYSRFDGFFSFSSCQLQGGDFGRDAGFYSFPIIYVLRVDVGDRAGSFTATTTWTLFS